MTGVDEGLTEYVRSSLDHDGFAVLPEIFTSEEMDQLRQVLSRHRDMYFASEITDGGESSQRQDLIEFHYPSVAEPDLLSSCVFQRCASLAQSVEKGFKLYFDSLITKAPNGQHTFFWHRDADQAPFARVRGVLLPRLHFWIPLQDVSRENGGLQFIAGSHRQKTIFHLKESRVFNSPLGAGSLTIHLPNTLHGSAANHTDTARSAWLMTFGRFGSLKLVDRT